VTRGDGDQLDRYTRRVADVVTSPTAFPVLHAMKDSNVVAPVVAEQTYLTRDGSGYLLGERVTTYASDTVNGRTAFFPSRTRELQQQAPLAVSSLPGTGSVSTLYSADTSDYGWTLQTFSRVAGALLGAASETPAGNRVVVRDARGEGCLAGTETACVERKVSGSLWARGGEEGGVRGAGGTTGEAGRYLANACLSGIRGGEAGTAIGDRGVERGVLFRAGGGGSSRGTLEVVGEGIYGGGATRRKETDKNRKGEMMKKMSGGALVYVVMMSLVVFLVVGLIFLRGELEHARLAGVLEQDWRRDQVISVATLLGRDYRCLLGRDRVLPGVPVRFQMREEEWGLWNVVKVISETRHGVDTAVLLCGGRYLRQDTTALYTVGKGRYLSVVGETVLRGRCYLPELGVRRGYVQGRSYDRDSLIYGEVRPVDESFPPVAEGYWERLRRWRDVTVMEAFRDTVRCSFRAGKWCYYSRYPIHLQAGCWEGQVQFVSEQRIEVDSGCTFRDGVLVAPEIYLASGFRGRGQLLAFRRVRVGSNVCLEYPSLICLYAGRKGELHLEEGTMVQGEVMAWGDSLLTCRLAGGSVVRGALYTAGRLQLEGTVYGTVYGRQLIYENEWGHYEDVICGGVVDRDSLWSEQVGMDWFGGSVVKPVMEELW